MLRVSVVTVRAESLFVTSIVSWCERNGFSYPEMVIIFATVSPQMVSA
jgi:hypothetical protein